MSYQIEKNFLNYKMSLISTLGQIIIIIIKKNSNDEFTSNFTLSNLKKYKFFLLSSTPKNIIDIILRLNDPFQIYEKSKIGKILDKKVKSLIYIYQLEILIKEQEVNLLMENVIYLHKWFKDFDWGKFD